MIWYLQRLRRKLRAALKWCTSKSYRALPKSVRKYGWVGYPYPEDNPFKNSEDWYSRMTWEKQHGWADYD